MGKARPTRPSGCRRKQTAQDEACVPCTPPPPRARHGQVPGRHTNSPSRVPPAGGKKKGQEKKWQVPPPLLSTVESAGGSADNRRQPAPRGRRPRRRERGGSRRRGHNCHTPFPRAARRTWRRARGGRSVRQGRVAPPPTTNPLRGNHFHPSGLRAHCARAKSTWTKRSGLPFDAISTWFEAQPPRVCRESLS